MATFFFNVFFFVLFLKKNFCFTILFYFPFHSIYFNYLFHLNKVISKEQKVQFCNCITQLAFIPTVKHIRRDVTTSSFRSFPLPKLKKHVTMLATFVFFFIFTTSRRCVIRSPFSSLSFFFTTMSLCS